MATANPNSIFAWLEGLWIQAGGDPNLAPTMAAISFAEDPTHSTQSNPDSGGSTSWGLWQINSANIGGSGVVPAGADLTNPLVNAAAAVAIEQSQGLNAWTTFRNRFSNVTGAGVSDVNQILAENLGTTPQVTGTPSTPQAILSGGGPSELPNCPTWLPFAGSFCAAANAGMQTAQAAAQAGGFVQWIQNEFNAARVLTTTWPWLLLGGILLWIGVSVVRSGDDGGDSKSNTVVVGGGKGAAEGGAAEDVAAAAA